MPDSSVPFDPAEWRRSLRETPLPSPPAVTGDRPWRILVTGSRTWDDGDALRSAIVAAAAERPEGTDLIIVHGDCPHGADAIADQWARDYGRRVERHPAEWSRFGKRAGFIRNQVMVEAGVDLCLAFIRGNSRGATHCADLAERAGIPVRRFDYHSISEEPVWPEGMYAP